VTGFWRRDDIIEATPAGSVESPVLTALRRFILALLVVAMTGTIVDLMLLEHHEDGWQMVPLVLLAAGVLAAAATLTGRAGALLLFRVIMALVIASGMVGLGLHYLGNTEFQKEMDPSLTGWPLFVKAMTAKAPPALAPASMVQMGVLGLLYTYHHPALRRSAAPLTSHR
jgi:hypothetical protein